MQPEQQFPQLFFQNVLQNDITLLAPDWFKKILSANQKKADLRSYTSMWRLWQLFTMAPWHFLNKIFDCLQTTKTVKLNGGTFGRALVECDPRFKTHCVNHVKEYLISVHTNVVFSYFYVRASNCSHYSNVGNKCPKLGTGTPEDMLFTNLAGAT